MRRYITEVFVVVSISTLLMRFVVATNPSNVAVQEEIWYDDFGIINHVQNQTILLRPFDKIKTIRIDYVGQVKNRCKLKLNLNIPDVFSPRIKILNSSVPIANGYTLDTDNLTDDNLTISMEAIVSLNDFSIAKEDVGNLSYDSRFDKYLTASDELFYYPIDDPKIRRIAESLNTTQNVLELIDEIKNCVKATLKHSDQETNANVLESAALGKGDCDDYARLFITLARAMSIPARPSFNSNHMWVEVCIPLKNGNYRWIIVDPTDSYGDVAYSLSFDIEPKCRNYVTEKEIWVLE